MARERKESEYMKELVESGRGERLLREFFRKVWWIKYGYLYRTPKGLPRNADRWMEWREEEK